MNRNTKPHSSLVQTPSNTDKLFSSQHSDGNHPSPKVPLAQKAMSDRPTLPQETTAVSKIFCETSPNSIGASEAVQAAVQTMKKLKCREKIRQNHQKLLKFKQKYSKMLVSSNSTTQSNESNHSDQPSQKCTEVISTEVSEIKGNIIFDASLKQEKKTGLIEFQGENGTQVFRILKYVSEGTSGKVYLAQHLQNHCIFSIKVIPRANLTKQLESQLLRELKIQSYLNHPNIVRLYHFFVDKQNVYLLLEPCLGNDLFKNLKEKKQGGFTEKEVRDVIKQVCQAVEYMHKKDIIHRDIKPENILIHEKVVKICDFGWAVHSPLLRDTRCGTPIYSSPEMIKKEQYDNKIDIWNIGVLTYELLYGNIPFQIRQLADLCKIIEQKIYFSKQILVSEYAKEFINGCMEKNPIERYTVRQAIEHDFMKDMDKFRWTIV